MRIKLDKNHAYAVLIFAGIASLIILVETFPIQSNTILDVFGFIGSMVFFYAIVYFVVLAMRDNLSEKRKSGKNFKPRPAPPKGQGKN